MNQVLVVTDDSSLIPVIRHSLQAAAYRPVFAPNGEESWRTLVLEAPEGLVIDVTSPADWGLAERIRSDGRFQRLPVVLLTGNGDPLAMKRAEALRCEHLTKPLSTAALLDKLRKARLESGPSSGGKIVLTSVEVVMMLDEYRVTGKLHLPPEVARFSDALEVVMKDARTFLPLTHATIATQDGTKIMGATELLEVKKEHIRLVTPVGGLMPTVDLNGDVADALTH